MKERSSSRSSRPLALLCAAALLGAAPVASAAVQASGGKGGVPKGQRSTLDTVRSIFQRLDADRDGRVTAAEARNAKVNDALFKVHDVDASQGLDRDEFTLLYRDLLTRARRAVPADLQSEVSRIQLRRRAAEDAKRKKEQADAEKGKAGAGTPTPKPAPAKPAGAGPAAAPVKAKPAPVAGQPAPAPRTPAPAPSSAPPVKKAGPAIRRPDAKKPPGVGKGSGANGGGSGTLTPEDQARLDQRIRLAREKWMLEMRAAQAKKDEQEAAKKLAEMETALGSKLPPELREELIARVSAERTSVLLQWVTANPKADLTSLSPKMRTELARMIDQSRTRAQNAWAAEKRAMLVERARRAKGDDGDAGKGADGGEKQRAGDVRRLKKKRGVVVQPAGSKPRAKGAGDPAPAPAKKAPAVKAPATKKPSTPQKGQGAAGSGKSGTVKKG